MVPVCRRSIAESCCWAWFEGQNRELIFEGMNSYQKSGKNAYTFQKTIEK